MPIPGGEISTSEIWVPEPEEIKEETPQEEEKKEQ